MNTRYLGLDPSLRAFGYCIITVDDTFSIKDIHFDTIKTKERNIFKCFSILEELESRKIIEEISYACVEHYNYDGVSQSIYELGELGGIVRYWLARNKVGFVEVPPNMLKQFATGNGQASKHMMVYAARNFIMQKTKGVIRFKTSDEADAFWAAYLAFAFSQWDKDVFIERVKLNVISKIILGWEELCPQSGSGPHPKFFLVQQNQRRPRKVRNSRSDTLKM